MHAEMDLTRRVVPGHKKSAQKISAKYWIVDLFKQTKINAHIFQTCINFADFEKQI